MVGDERGPDRDQRLVHRQAGARAARRGRLRRARGRPRRRLPPPRARRARATSRGSSPTSTGPGRPSSRLRGPEAATRPWASSCCAPTATSPGRPGLRHAALPRLLPRRVRLAAQRPAPRPRRPRVVTPPAMVAPYYDRRRASDRDGESFVLRPLSGLSAEAAATQRSSVAAAAPESIASRARAMPAASASSTGVARRVVDGERRAGVEQHGVAHRPVLAVEQPAHDVGVVRRVATAQRLGGRAARGRVRRVDRRLVDLAVVDHPHRRRRRGGELVEPVVAAEHPRVDAAARRTRRPSPAPSAGRRSRSPGRRAGPGWPAGRGS